AGALAELARHSLVQDFRRIRTESARIIVVEGSPYVLPTFPEPLRDAARKSLEQLGVDVRTGAVVTGIDEEGVTIQTKSSETTHIRAATVLWGAGVAASPIAKSLGVPLDRIGRVTPEPTLALTAHPTILIVGDLGALPQDGV